MLWTRVNQFSFNIKINHFKSQTIKMNKRKVPDSNYIAPTHYNRSISHQHTNSLPVETPPLHPQHAHINHHLSESTNNLPYYKYSTNTVQYNPQYTLPASIQYTNLKQEPVSSHKVLDKLHHESVRLCI